MNKKNGIRQYVRKNGTKVKVFPGGTKLEVEKDGHARLVSTVSVEVFKGGDGISCELGYEEAFAMLLNDISEACHDDIDMNSILELSPISLHVEDEEVEKKINKLIANF